MVIRVTLAAAALALHGTAVTVATAALGPVSAVLSVRPAPERKRAASGAPPRDCP